MGLHSVRVHVVSSSALDKFDSQNGGTHTLIAASDGGIPTDMISIHWSFPGAEIAKRTGHKKRTTYMPN